MEYDNNLVVIGAGWSILEPHTVGTVGTDASQ